MTFKRKAVPFDTFVGGCNYFDGNSDVNNGYGCTHPEQEEKQKGKGCCFCFSCPLGTPADEESFEEPDIDWNGRMLAKMIILSSHQTAKIRI